MRIHSNFLGMNANRNFALHNNRIAKAMQRLSTGRRINSAADDPAGLAVAEKLKMKLTNLKTDKRNAIDYQSMLEVAEGSLNEIHSMLNRMTELAQTAASGTCDELDRRNMESEYRQLADEIDRIGKTSAFNGKKLFGEPEETSDTGVGASGTAIPEGAIVYTGGNLNAYLEGLDKLLMDISQAAAQNDNEHLLSLGIDRENGKSDSENLKNAITVFTQENANRLLNSETQGDSKGAVYKLILSDGELKVDLAGVSSEELGIADTNLLTQENAKAAQEAIKDAINRVSSQRGSLGAMHRRLDHTINNISNMEENLTNALSRIMDADMAKEMMILTKEKVLAQASMFVMAQANQEPERVLSLINSM